MRRALALIAVSCWGGGPRPTRVAVAPDETIRAIDAGTAMSGEVACDGAAGEEAPACSKVEVAPAGRDDTAEMAPTAGWRKGSTHVHAAPSGDSTAPIPEVIAWYERRGYDFIVLTDHNKVTTIEAQPSARGVGAEAAAVLGEPAETATAAASVAVRAPADGLIVLAGVELTHNPASCDPPPPLAGGACRIHVNALAVTGRPAGRIEWADHAGPRRIDKYQRALDTTAALGGLAQLNHPQWHWGTTADLLIELGRRGVTLVEIANRQFDRWNSGSRDFPSTEALWDAALAAGVTLWGVATDDAHSYDRPGRYPAGGGWVMVWAARDPQAISDALAQGRFYSSTGVILDHAGVVDGDLVVEVAAASPGDHTITFIGPPEPGTERLPSGRVLREVCGRAARFSLADAPGYVRAVIARDDGSKAWVQPARPPP